MWRGGGSNQWVRLLGLRGPHTARWYSPNKNDDTVQTSGCSYGSQAVVSSFGVNLQ